MKTLVILLFALIAAGGCKVEDPPPIGDQVFTDDFERTRIGGNYYKTGGNYEIVDGALHVRGAYNHPLWLRKKLPRDVEIELDVWAESADGDLKIEVFGDGKSHARDKGAYTATGYVAVHGGWNNSKSILARRDEHGEQLAERTQPRVQVGKKYHWKFVRQGDQVDWYIDDMDTPFLSYTDASPLAGPGHEYFGFNNWESDAYFDNLVIRPL
jgi:hypothetical protein